MNTAPNNHLLCFGIHTVIMSSVLWSSCCKNDHLISISPHIIWLNILPGSLGRPANKCCRGDPTTGFNPKSKTTKLKKFKFPVTGKLSYPDLFRRPTCRIHSRRSPQLGKSKCDLLNICFLGDYTVFRSGLFGSEYGSRSDSGSIYTLTQLKSDSDPDPFYYSCIVWQR